MRSPAFWFLIIAIVCVAGIYLFGLRPKTRLQWILVSLTIAFAAWLLPMMASLR